MKRRLALFLDRDGVINIDQGYVHRVDQFVWIPGVFDTARTANRLGLAVIVATNQAGIARGYYSERQFQELTDWMKAQFAAADAPLAGVYYCPYHPDGLPPYDKDSPFRKPGTGMLVQAAAEHGLDLAASVLIGDRESDIAADASRYRARESRGRLCMAVARARSGSRSEQRGAACSLPELKRNPPHAQARPSVPVPKASLPADQGRTHHELQSSATFDTTLSRIRGHVHR